MPDLSELPHTDVQATKPRVAVSLSRVGVTETEKVVRLRTPEGDQLYTARFDCAVDLGTQQKGAHMSRFEEVINESIGEFVVDGVSTVRAEELATRVAESVRERQDAAYAEVSMVARYPENKPAPVSGINTQEIYTLLATAAATEQGTRRIIGVQAQGMTACPCAQELVAESSRVRLRAGGYSEAQIAEILEAVPVATHNQRGLGTLEVGLDIGDSTDLDARQLVAIVEQSMSSEIFELMKRSDEGSVVERAHRNPRFVEDCVREAIAGTLDQLPNLSDEAWLHARQENLETIHQHNVVASRWGLLGEIRRELAGAAFAGRGHLGRTAWLRGLR